MFPASRSFVSEHQKREMSRIDVTQLKNMIHHHVRPRNKLLIYILFVRQLVDAY